MDSRSERIDYLTKSFETHPAAEFLGAKLVHLLGPRGGMAFATVSAVAKREFMVHSDLKSDFIVQGGISFAIANFAGVYAAMLHTKQHTPLSLIEEIRYVEPVCEGEEMIAYAMATRESDLNILVNVVVTNKELKPILRGKLYYRDKGKK